MCSWLVVTRAECLCYSATRGGCNLDDNVQDILGYPATEWAEAYNASNHSAVGILSIMFVDSVSVPCVTLTDRVPVCSSTLVQGLLRREEA